MAEAHRFETVPLFSQGGTREISQCSISKVVLEEFGVSLSLNKSFAYQQIPG